MKMRVSFYCIFLLLPFYNLTAGSTFESNMLPDSIKKAPANWYNLDPANDGIIGVSTERAYNELLKNKKSSKVVVAIIDSGIETDHEDLKESIWTNTGEIPGNRRDDDNNGYIDDINGWDFIGGPDSTFVQQDTWELTREYRIFSKKYELKEGESLMSKDLEDWEYYLALKADYDKQFTENKEAYENILHMKNKIISSELLLKSYLSTDTLITEDLMKLTPGIDSIDEALMFIQNIRSQKITLSRLQEGIKYYETNLNYKLNPDFEPRYIVGDNYLDLGNRNYGNNYVEGPDAFHGTHVCGIVCANRENSIGIKGIAKDVEIMVLRVVPSGDERDKDVANAVFYAVDNGARIINMSFGKDYSPFKYYVDSAFRYADQHGVLIVHAAGNDSKDSDKYPSYPTKKYLDGKGECSNWIEVGAIHWKDGREMVGGFTNYGKKTVDLFAPGVEIYSTMPGQGYRNASGTSMSAPVVTGVAALVLSYHPDLTASELKTILLDSAVSYKRKKVKKPGNPEDLIRFSRLSKTGAVVNAYTALKAAEKY